MRLKTAHFLIIRIYLFAIFALYLVKVVYFIAHLQENAYLNSYVYPNLTDNEALSLALSGLDDYVRDSNGNIRPEVDKAAREKYNTSMADASAIANQFYSGTKGSPCAN